MVQFTRLRINGFKSFVERTELDIGSGLNGVVGPNGCGKSNLVEALRWVMGENSAKRMRGDGMEDVIFNGTEKRTARNIAEVSLLLDNSARTAPAAYNGSDEIEITRRIERDRGSLYKINGKAVRARDVQMLFADTVTGANSPALVSQGRVTQIINSKPQERRLILEESAGISGLFARRHEAELRLKAADANMLRIEDVLGGMETRLSSLKRQARQATRYKNISAQIRHIEILLAHLEWEGLQERISNIKKTFENAERLTAERMVAVTQLTKTQTTQAQDIPALRQKEAEAAAALQTQKIALQRLEDDAQRLSEALEEATVQLERTRADRAHESQSIAESEASSMKLESEQKALLEEETRQGDKLQENERLKDALEIKVRNLEDSYTALMQSEAENRALRQSLEQQIKQNKERLNAVKARKDNADSELSAFQETNKDRPNIALLEQTVKDLETKSLEAEQQVAASVDTIEKQKALVQSARENLRTTETKAAEFGAEIAMLESFFADSKETDFKPVIDSISAENGFEKALSRALGDALMASLDEQAPTRWTRRLSAPDMPPLPEGVQSLAPFIKAPAQLTLALSQIGYSEADELDVNVFEALKPGQSIVSKSGHYWRWDGLTIKAEAADRNALHLEQKNKLRELQKRKDKVLREKELALENFDAATHQLAQDESRLEDLRKTVAGMAADLTARRREASEAREMAARHDGDIARLTGIVKMAEEDLLTLSEVIRWDEERLKAYEAKGAEKKAEDIETLRATLAEAREAHQDAIRTYDSYVQTQNTRKARLHAIADERINLKNRLIRSKERLKELEMREAALKEKLQSLKSQPHDFQKQRESLLEKISRHDAIRSEAAENLSARESEVGETTKALKEAERLLNEAREERAGAQATFQALNEQKAPLEISIEEQFNLKPQELSQHLTMPVDQAPPSIDSIRSQKEKLVRERESIGPVNLRADQEMQDLEKEVTTLLNERNDLTQAIEELRGGINKINREARERLLSAFEHVNAHFQRLFVRLFGGGQAHLALIDSEDPLGAGLEIFAQPPGKTLQSLSLLSGGEQTLASIALIFAMFLTNPSPICVLDEIDAPLDDANVDRVCNLLEEIAARGETRFLVITHHRLTMARMNRLYGVTMAEKGVSQLVSVDLQQSFDFIEAA